jgi:hypothetical protein
MEAIEFIKEQIERLNRKKANAKLKAGYNEQIKQYVNVLDELLKYHKPSSEETFIVIRALEILAENDDLIALKLQKLAFLKQEYPEIYGIAWEIAKNYN